MIEVEDGPLISKLLAPCPKPNWKGSLNMIFGIQKRQWFLLLLAVSVPLLLNAVAICQDVGIASILKMWNGTYPNFLGGFLGGPYKPLPEIFLKLLLFSAALGLLAWLMVLISNKTFFQRQPRIIIFCETFLMTFLVAIVFGFISGYFMPLVWLPLFHNYQLGLPGSSFMVDWSRWLVFPTTVIFLFSAIFLSGDKES